MRNGKSGGYVSRVIYARLNRQQENQTDAPSVIQREDLCPCLNYFKDHSDEKPFPDQALLDLMDSKQHSNVVYAVDQMLQSAVDSGLPNGQVKQLAHHAARPLACLPYSFSAGPPAKFESLKIELTPDARPVRVKLCNHSHAQREFLSEIVTQPKFCVDLNLKLHQVKCVAFAVVVCWCCGLLSADGCTMTQRTSKVSSKWNHEPLVHACSSSSVSCSG